MKISLKREKRRLRAFGYIFHNSISSRDYYNDLLKTDIRFSFKYYMTLAIVFTVFASLIASFRVSPQFKRFLNEKLFEIEKSYPDDLEIRVSQGNWEINKTMPYELVFPYTNSFEGKPATGEVIIIFDNEGKVEDLEKENVIIVVNEKNVLYLSNNTLQTYPISNIPDTIITKGTITNTINSIQKLTYATYLIIFLGSAVMFLLYTVLLRTIYIFGVAGSLWIAGLFKGLTLPFAKYYQIGLHTISIPYIIELLLFVFGVHGTIPFWFLTVHLIISIYVTFSLDFATQNDKMT
jgi:hypothetical protein